MTKNFSNNMRTTAFVALFCFLFWILIWSSTNFIRNQILGNLPDKSQFVGEIVQTEHKVLKNFSGRLTWQSVEPGDAIHLGSSIQTLENSNTVLQLSDGQRVDIAANSLIRIQKSENGLSLELIDGEIQLETISAAESLNSLSGLQANEKSSGEIRIKTKDGYIKSKHSSLKISQKKNSKEPPKIEVYKGSLTSVSEKGIETELKLPVTELKSKSVEKAIAALKKNELLEVNEVGLSDSSTAVENRSSASPIPVEPAQITPTSVPNTEVQAELPAPVVNQPLEEVRRMPSSQKPKVQSSRREKSLPLPEKKPLQAPKIKRVDVKVVE